MSKKYEYSVVLSEQKSGEDKRINVILGHPMTEVDLSAIETKYSKTNDTKVYNYYRVVTFWKLLKVTGTFTYLFHVELSSMKSDSTIVTIMKTFDHKITTSSIKADFEQAETDCLEQEKLSKFGVYKATVFSYQEIPSE